MCGIVGYTGRRQVVDILLQGLSRLEYRGYDSAGVALLHGSRIDVIKAQGKLANVEALIHEAPPATRAATCGIGHTRWATHGKPTTQNAHPHRTGHVVLVHNGIIENYQEIRRKIIARGHHPQSETDSELFGFLVLDRMEEGGLSLVEAVQESFAELQGQCGVVVMSEREPGVIIGVRNGSPLVAAQDPQGGTIMASDVHPILGITRDLVYLESGDVVVGTPDGMEIFSLKTRKKMKRETTRLDWSVENMDKQGYDHYMLKEIHEQPTVLMETLKTVLDRESPEPFALAERAAGSIIRHAKEIRLIACGTAWHAAMTGAYWIESLGGVKATVELASEFRYRSPVMDPEREVLIAVSQSGETADTLAALRLAREAGVPAFAITNCRGSSLAREADAVFYTSAGPEIGVAATKTFTTQMMVLYCLAGHLAYAHARTDAAREKVKVLLTDLVKVPYLIANALESDSSFKQRVSKTSAALGEAKGFFFIGRGYSFPLALEGALKLKEISYIPAEGYAAGELKHGPIAMIDPGMAVVVLAPQDAWRDKTMSNLEEVKARGGVIVGVGDAGDHAMESISDHWIPMTARGGTHTVVHESQLPFLLAPVLQLLSYELALGKGTDIDKPRNLAKSVTVE